MLTEINEITQEFFQKKDFENISKEELQEFIRKYPYSATSRFLLAYKISGEEDKRQGDEIITASLYIHNPLWLDWLLNHTASEKDAQHAETMIKPSEEALVSTQEESAEEPVKVAVAQPTPPVEKFSGSPAVSTDSPIVFQSYHTIDYFASQGIRLQQSDLNKDRLGQQLKSFTEWLKSMKKLQSPSASAVLPEDEKDQQAVLQNAAVSIEEKEVVTEAMAEVWAKQGNKAKARNIYSKLSLQNPDKSAYFAAKIDQLK